VPKATIQSANVEMALHRAVASGERIAGWVRIVISTVALLQYLAFNGLVGVISLELRPVLVVFNLLTVLVVSAWMLYKLDPGGVSDRFLFTSVGVDSLACLMVVLPNALWPETRYEGLLDVPNMGFFLLAIFLSGFRLSPRLAAYSLLVNCLALGFVLRIDVSHGFLWGNYGGQELVVLGILMVSAGLLAIALGVSWGCMCQKRSWIWPLKKVRSG
jgi:hypothetical protein